MEFGAAVFGNGAWIDGEFGEERIVLEGAAVNSPHQAVEEPEAVLKRAASVFFADMVTSSSSETFARPSSIAKEADSHSLEPFPFAHPLWEDFDALKAPASAPSPSPAPSPAPALAPALNLWDLNAPLLPPKIVTGGGGDREEDPLIDFQDIHHGRYFGKEPFSQYQYDDPCIVGSYGGSIYIGQTLAGVQSCSGGSSVQAGVQSDANLIDQLYSPAAQQQDQPAAAAKVGAMDLPEKPLYSRIRNQDEDEQDLEFGKFCDGDKQQQQQQQSECQVLISSISILSKVLLSHYGSGTNLAAAATADTSNQTERKELQSAILDLSKCLAHAHGQRSIPVDDAKQAEETKSDPFEDPSFGLYSETDEQHGEHDEDGNEQLVTRFKLLLNLAGAGRYVKDPIPQEDVFFDAKPEPEEKPEATPYLNSNEVEQRLALLRNRPKPIDDAGGDGSGAAKEEIYVGEDYVAKRTAYLQELSDEISKHGLKESTASPPAGRIPPRSNDFFVKNVDKASDSGEESGWEHI